MVTIFAGYSSFEWLKLTCMTDWASQRIADKTDCDLCWSLWSVNQCFFKVFERVSWWSFRVPKPFSHLCLILLT